MSLLLALTGGSGGVTGTAVTSQAQTIASTGAAAVAAVSGTGASSQAQTIDSTGSFSAVGVVGNGSTSQAQTVAASGAASVASVSGTATTSQAQTSALAGNASPAAVSGTGSASQAQTIAASGSFAGAAGVSGVGATSQGQTASGVGSVSGGEVIATDTHDGYWTKQWLKRKPKRKDLIEAIQENPIEIVEAIAEVKQKVTRVYPNIDYNAVKENIKLQRFIANQILEALQRQQDEDDEIEALFLLM